MNVHCDRSIAIDDNVRVFTRPGRDATASVPELADLVDAVPPGTVLDGELVAGSGRARSFYQLSSALYGDPSRRAPVTFAIFDILSVDGRTLRGLPYLERRALLDELALQGWAWCTLPFWSDVTIRDLIGACAEHDVEGIVAKRVDSRYESGRRSPAWVKIKTDAWRTAHASRRHELANSR